MNVLTVAWSAASAMAILSIACMVVLIAARLVRERQDALLAQSRLAIARLARPADADPAGIAGHIARLARRDELAPIIQETLATIAPLSRDAFLSRLARLGVPRALRWRLKRAATVGRVRAAEALAAFSPAEAQAALRRSWSDRNPRVRLAAARASIDLGAPPSFEDTLTLAQGAGPANPAREDCIVRRIGAIFPDEASAALARPNLPPRLRVALAESLSGATAPNVLAALMEVTKAPDPEMRAAAIGVLGASRSPASCEAVIKGLTDPAWPVRVRAANAAGALHLAEARPLLRRLGEDANWWVRLRAADAIRTIDGAVTS